MEQISNTGAIYSIVQHDRYVALLGKQLWICRNDGTVISRKSDVKNPHKVAFLSDNRLLVDCGSLGSYILLSLEDGTEIRRIVQPKIDTSLSNFAISPDERFIYDCFTRKGKEYIVCIDTFSWESEICALQPGLRAVSDLCCDCNGELCLLEHHYEEVASRHISCNGIRFVYRDTFAPGSSYYWKQKWNMLFPRIASFFIGDTETILTNDLQIYKPATNELYNLLANETQWERPDRGPSNIQLSGDKKYLVLLYPTMNVVVDISGRKTIARYAADFSQGCLIGDSFWIYNGSGVAVKEFPIVENTFPEKYKFWKP